MLNVRLPRTAALAPDTGRHRAIHYELNVLTRRKRRRDRYVHRTVFRKDDPHVLQPRLHRLPAARHRYIDVQLVCRVLGYVPDVRQLSACKLQLVVLHQRQHLGVVCPHDGALL